MDEYPDSTDQMPTPATDDDGGVFGIEEFLTETVEEFRGRFDQLERAMSTDGFEPVEAGVHPIVRATWTTGAYECDHEWDVDHPAQIPVEFGQSYELSFVDPEQHRRFFASLRRVYEPLAAEAIELQIQVALPPSDQVTVRGRNGRDVVRRFDCSVLRGELDALSGDTWLVVEYGDGMPESCFEYSSTEKAIVDVHVVVAVVISLVAPGEDGSYVADQAAHASLEIPVDQDSLSRILALGASGIGLDDAVERVTGSRWLHCA